MPIRPLRAAIYVRISRDKTGEGEGVERQLKACKALCKSREWRVYGKPYRDNDTSASSDKERPEFERMIRDAQAGKFDAIVAWHPDRLARKMKDLERLIDLGDIKIATATGDLDLSNDMGRILARVIIAVAQGEVERKSARQRAANSERAAAGRHHSSVEPFGFEFVPHPADPKRKTMVQVPEEAEAIRLAYKDLIDSKGAVSLSGIARRWNEQGFTGSKGAPWIHAGVHKVLRSPRNAGIREYHGEATYKAEWRPIISLGRWKKAQAILDDESRKTNKGKASRKFILSGIARCGYPGCGKSLSTGRVQYGRVRADGSDAAVRTYTCATTHHLSRSAEPVDAFITALVLARLRQPDAKQLLVETPDDSSDKIQRRIAEAQEQLDALPAAFAASLKAKRISVQAVQAAEAQLMDEIAGLEVQLQSSGRADVLRDLVNAHDPADVWQHLDVSRRHAVVKCLLEITLLPAGRGSRTFRPETVVTEWKHA